MSRAVSLTFVSCDLNKEGRRNGHSINQHSVPNHQRNEESTIQINILSTDPNVSEPLNHFTAIQPLDRSTVTKSLDHPTVIVALID